MTNRVQHFMRRVTQNSGLQRELCIHNKIMYQNNKISINNSINNLLVNKTINNTINKTMEKEEDKKRRKEKERQNEIELQKIKDFLRKHNDHTNSNLEKLKKERTKYSL